MAQELQGKRVAALVTDGFEQSELLEPRKALQEAGAEVHVIAPKGPTVRGWSKGNWADEVKVDRTLAEARPGDYDALLLPGGVHSPDKLRINEEALAFVRAFGEAGKPIAAICHGPWTLIDAGLVRGRRMTSYASIKTDLINAGAIWENQQVVVDQGLVTSRNPGDIPAFNAKMIEEFKEGVHKARAAG
jgi:protease I